MLELRPPEAGEFLTPVRARLDPDRSTPPLSGWFEPFLDRFVAQAQRVGGQAVVAVEDGATVGLLLTDPEERTASLFARTAEVAAALRPLAGGVPTYEEADRPAPREEFVVYTVPLPPPEPHRFRHPVRLLRADDADAVAALLAEVYGHAPRRWLEVAGDEGEVGLGTEVDGRLAGVAWVLAVGGTARLHGLTVRADRRRLGVGADLLHARLLYAAQRGAVSALSEIAVENTASRALAERSGARDAGRVYLYRSPPEGGPVARPPAVGELP